MKVISIGTDRKFFEENSSVRYRNIEYGKYFDELHIIVFNLRDKNVEKGNIKIIENVFIYPTNSSSKLFYIWDAFKIIKSLKISNCIVSVGDPFETGAVGILTKLLLGLPLHVQVHTDFMHKYFRQLSLLNKVRFFMAELVLKYSDRVRVVSERVKKSIGSFSKNIDVLPIKTEISQGETLGQIYKISPLEKPFSFTLLMVCRLEKEKNIETVFGAIKDLDKNIGLCLVGDGSQKVHLESLAKDLGILGRVVFAGWKENLASYYKMADAFISSSLYEGYGISTVEAAFFGKSLILSETGVAEEIFKENESAFICDAKDKACFAKNILKIYQDKNLAERMGQSAKVVAEKHLNSEKNYFEEYADSIIKTADNFKKSNLISRIFIFKISAFNSFIFLRYFICGITSAVINIVILYILTDTLGIWYLYSSIFAFLASLIISFVLQKFVVFKDMKTSRMRHQFSIFFVVAALGVITNTAIIFVCVDVFGIWYILSQIIAGFFVMVQNFILYKFFIFNKSE